MADDSVPPPVDPNQDVEAEPAGDEEEIEDVFAKHTRTILSSQTTAGQWNLTFRETKMHGNMAPIFFVSDIQFR